MGLFDMFTASTPATSTTTPSNSANSNPTVPSATNTPTITTPAADTVAANGGDKSPLSQFDKLWDNDPNAKADTPFTFNSDPTKLLESARTVDFTKAISSELMAKINAGGQGAQQAMLEAMNNVSQLTYAQSSQAASKIAEQAVAATEQRFKDMLPGLLKQAQVRDMQADNPLLSNPASAPMVEALQMQMTKKFPTASSAEIKSHVNDYLNTVADMIAAQRPQPKVAAIKPSEDWSKFFE